MRYKSKKFYSYFLVLLLSILFVLVFLIEPLSVTVEGYKNIMTSSSILLTDYLLIGGLSATLFNVLTTTLLNIVILKWLKVEFNGAIFACLLTIAGFAFFGKNLYNALPIYFGIFLYTKASKTNLKDNIPVFLLSSGISPITSYLIFGAGLNLSLGIPLGIGVGIIVGFILPAFNQFAMKFHQGYNLYNTGFSMGVISMILTGILLSFGININRSAHLSTSYHEVLLICMIFISFIFLLLSVLEDKSAIKKYFKIFTKSGKLITDYFSDFGYGVTFLNISFMGLFSTVLILSMGISISGPVMGAILTIIGFSALGKNPFNSACVVLGAIIAIEFTPIEYSIGSILSILFVTGLSPVAGQFGALAGIVAGFIHVMITPLVLSFQGGFDLYNNGFAAGFVAALLVPVFTVFLNKREETKSWNFILSIKRIGVRE